jgi:hypothetical protein
MLVPAAQALAAGTLTVNVEGIEGGSGEVSSVGGSPMVGGAGEGSPPIECSGPPSSGTCQTEMEEVEEGFHFIGLHAVAAPGSELVGWEQEGGNSSFCPFVSGDPNECGAIVEGAPQNVTVTAYFACETEGGCEGPSGPELTITKEGTGSGTVVSNPAGIECGGTCSAQFEENTKVTLTASPSAGSLFLSWKGCETGGAIGRQCTVTMDKAKTVVAKFITAYDVTVNRVGSGLGKVGSSPGGVLCLSNCESTTASFKEGVSVTLNAAPSKNFVFTEWTGDCSGSGPCSLGALGEDKEVGAKFTEVAKHLLTLTKSGGGQGTVKGKPAGINCGATCPTQAAAYYEGAVVELTATPGKGSSFGGWSGSGCSGTGTCLVTMSAAKAVTAEFK